jgi:REP element-mobilizing transposase RayT
MKILPQRKSIRLKNYNYASKGFYFVTICTQNRKCLFGNIVDKKMVLNDVGRMVKYIWQLLPNRYAMELDAFQIMPNHIHSIVQITVGATLVVARSMRAGIKPELRAGIKPELRAGIKPAPTATLGNIIGAFKSLTTHKYINGVKNNNWPRFNKRLWQRNFYEHIIRNENDLNRIRKYIKNNPKTWDRDKNNPKNLETLHTGVLVY